MKERETGCRHGRNSEPAERSMAQMDPSSSKQNLMAGDCDQGNEFFGIS
jgi:hypothetical protein